jgi:hypothetical protein
MLFLDGVYAENPYGKYRFYPCKVPTSVQLSQLTHTISHRLARFLEREGLLERDTENTWLALDEEPDALEQLQGHSISYRIALGPQRGKKVLTLQTLPPADELDTFSQAGKVAGFSLHAGVAAKAHERDKLERLCRYISRPAVSEKRLAITANGMIRYKLKTPYKNGTTHVMFEPLDFLARLAALIPKPRTNLTRFHGVFAPNSKHRADITPAKRGKAKKKEKYSEETNWQDKTVPEQHAAMRWAQRLKRVFDIDAEVCEHCGGTVKVIACIEDPQVIKTILAHLDQKTPTVRLLCCQKAEHHRRWIYLGFKGLRIVMLKDW